MSAGVGQSKQFGTGPFEDVERGHVDGRPVGSGSLDHLLASAYTDEGLAEKDARPKAKSSVVRDAFDKVIQERRDFRVESNEPWMAPDPMGQLVDEYCPEGHRPRFLSDAKVAKEGRRGWQPVISESGEPVKLGNMTLASMPIERAQKRNAFYAGKDAERIQHIYDTQREQIHQSGLRTVDTSQRGGGGLQRTSGNTTALDD